MTTNEGTSWCDVYIQKVQETLQLLKKPEGAEPSSLEARWAGLMLQATQGLLAAALQTATADSYSLGAISVEGGTHTPLNLEQFIEICQSTDRPQEPILDTLEKLPVAEPEPVKLNPILDDDDPGEAADGAEDFLEVVDKDEEPLDRRIAKLKEEPDEAGSAKAAAAKKRRRKMPRTGIKRIITAPAELLNTRLRQRPQRKMLIDGISDPEDNDDDDSTFNPAALGSNSRKRGRKKTYEDPLAQEDDGLLANKLKFSAYKCFLCETEPEFGDRDELGLHLLESHVRVSETGKKSLACPMCEDTKPMKKLRPFWTEKDEAGHALVKVLQHLYHEHQRTVPPYVATWKCPRCDYFTVRKYNHRTHLLSHADPVQCRYCPAKIKPSCMKIHLISCPNYVHRRKPGGGVKCPKCGKMFALKNSLSVHLTRVHSNKRNLSCFVCNKAFLTNKEMISHLFNKHNLNIENRQVFKCDKCPFQDLNVSELRKHVKRVHHSSHHLCDTCGKVFNHPAYLIKHKRIHESKELLCPHCPYVTNRKEAIETHIDAQHRNRKIACPAHCGYTTGYSANMTKHMKKCPNRPVDPNPPPNIYQCPSGCGFSASQPGNLTRHTHHCKVFQNLVELGMLNPTTKQYTPIAHDLPLDGSRTPASQPPPIQHPAQPPAPTIINHLQPPQVQHHPPPMAQQAADRVLSPDPVTPKTSKGVEGHTVTLQPLLPPVTSPPLMMAPPPVSHHQPQHMPPPPPMPNHANPAVMTEPYPAVYTDTTSMAAKFMYPYFQQ